MFAPHSFQILRAYIYAETNLYIYDKIFELITIFKSVSIFYFISKTSFNVCTASVADFILFIFG